MVKGWTVMLSVGQFFRPQRPPPEEPEEAPPPMVQYRDTSYVPQAPVKSSRRFAPGFIVALVGLVMVFGSMFLPWYFYTISGKVWIGNIYYNVYDRDEFTFNGISSVEEKSVPGFTVTDTYNRSWGDYDNQYKNAHHKPSRVTGVYSSVLVVLVAAGTLCALGAFLAVLFRLKKRPMLFPAVVLLAGALVALSGAGAFSAWHPPAVKEDGALAHQPDYPTLAPSGPYDSFSGEGVRSPLTYKWGPGAGWYVAMAGPALVIAGAVVLYAMNRGREE